MTKKVNPKQLNDLICTILSDKITECEQRQLNEINNDNDEKSLYFQGAIEVLSELSKQVEKATEILTEKYETCQK